MGDTVRYGTPEALTARAPSPILWANVDFQQMAENPAFGISQFDDFQNSMTTQEEAARSAWTGGIGHVLGDINWQAFTETALVVDVALQADNDGVLMLDTDGTDDDTVGITGGDNTIGVFKTPAIGASKSDFVFETRVKVSTITDGDLSCFFGLMEPGKLSNGSPLGAAGALADVDYIGFHITEADGDALSIVFNEASAGVAQSTAVSSITLVADTYVRLGFKLVTVGVGVAEIRFFVDGVDLGDAFAISIATANANYPSATDMDLMLTATSGTNGADGDDVKIDWVRAAQSYPTD